MKIIKQSIVVKVLIISMIYFGQRTTVAEEEFHAIVAQDGSGNYTTVSDAVKAAPSHSPTRFKIKVKAGVYKESVIVEQDKQNLELIGEGADVTIITYNKSKHTFESATVEIKGSNFIGRYITFKNSAGIDAGQAVALKVSSKYSAFYKCKIDGYQDTLLADTGYQFFRECTISGTVDFIFGAAPTVFQNCEINVHNNRGGTVLTAQGKDKDTMGKSAFSFHNCTIKAAKDFNSRSTTFLGRSWKDHSTVVFMESFLDSIIDPLGWETMTGEPISKSVFYGEYKNTGPGSNMEKRVTWARPGKLNAVQAQEYTVRNLIQGNLWLPSVGIPFMLDLMKNQYD